MGSLWGVRTERKSPFEGKEKIPKEELETKIKKLFDDLKEKRMSIILI